MKGISGGERKRTSIGVELITDPPLIMLDGKFFGDFFFISSLKLNRTYFWIR